STTVQRRITMQDWKQAFWLAKFELSESKRVFINLFLYFSLFIVVFVTTSYAVGDFYFGGLDVFFLLLFTYVPVWIRPKAFQYQKTGTGMWASPAVMMQTQLPIPKKIITKSRFIIYFIYSFPFQLFLFVSLYVFSPNISSDISPMTYIVFSIIWLSFGIYGGNSALLTDVGAQIKGGKIYFVLTILLWLAIVLFITFFGVIFQHGIVHWTMIFAQKW